MPELPLHIKWAKLFYLIPIPDTASFAEARRMFWRSINGRVYRIIDWSIPKNPGMWKPKDAIVTLFYGIYPAFGKKGLDCAIFHFFLDMFCFYIRTGFSPDEAFVRVINRLRSIIEYAEWIMKKKGYIEGVCYGQKMSELMTKATFLLIASEYKGKNFFVASKTFLKYLRSAVRRVYRYGRRYKERIANDCLVHPAVLPREHMV